MLSSFTSNRIDASSRREIMIQKHEFMDQLIIKADFWHYSSHVGPYDSVICFGHIQYSLPISNTLLSFFFSANDRSAAYSLRRRENIVQGGPCF
jgi:hypothetical protein